MSSHLKWSSGRDFLTHWDIDLLIVTNTWHATVQHQCELKSGNARAQAMTNQVLTSALGHVQRDIGAQYAQ
jgi:hypothetical protein